jgi:hypothetical protein
MPTALRTAPMLKASIPLASVVSPSGQVVLRVVVNVEKELVRASIPTAKESTALAMAAAVPVVHGQVVVI